MGADLYLAGDAIDKQERHEEMLKDTRNMFEWLSTELNEPIAPAAADKIHRLNKLKRPSGNSVKFWQLFDAEREVVESRIFNMIRNYGEERFIEFITPKLATHRIARDTLNFFESYKKRHKESRAKKRARLNRELGRLDDKIREKRAEIKRFEEEEE